MPRTTIRRVYVIELRPPWVTAVAGAKATPGRRCFYVGESAYSAEERTAQHCTSTGYRVAKVFKDARRAKSTTGDWRDASLIRGTDVWLRTRLFAGLPGFENAGDSEDLEAKVVDSLRRQGHLVYPRNVGRVPFK